MNLLPFSTAALSRETHKSKAVSLIIRKADLQRKAVCLIFLTGQNDKRTKNNNLYLT